MSRFLVQQTPISDLLVLEKLPLVDERGSLTRLFCQNDFKAIGFDVPIAQINHTVTKKTGSVRGFHYQNSPYSEIKFVQCIRGSVWDVAIDLRHGSKTFLKWHSVELSDRNQLGFLIPQGFAHGFQTLEDDTELLYFHSQFYNPEAECGISVLEPKLEISWPLPVVNLSLRDERHLLLSDDFEGVKL